MPRFGVKAVLVVLSAAALWLSSFTNYIGSDDVRRAILLFVTCASVAMAFSTSGQRRAFWLGFVVVLGLYF
jgi:hypothetical protein